MRFVRHLNLAASVYFILFGVNNDVRILGLLLLPLAIISIYMRPDKNV